MISHWLASNPRNSNPYGFAVIDLYDTNTVDRDQLVDYLSDRLVEGLVAPNRLEEIFRKAGLGKMLALLRDRVVERKTPVLIGDFGEIVVAEILKELDGYLIPIAKLRFREKRNWPMRLTDVLGIKHDDRQLIELCLCEVKTRTLWNRDCEQVGLKAYKSLEEEASQRIPEIVEFVSSKLQLAQDYELANLMDTFLLADDPTAIPRCCVLVLFFDNDIWQEVVLANIATAPVTIGDFSTKVVRVPQLRQLIDSSYNRVIEKRNGSNAIPAAS